MVAKDKEDLGITRPADDFLPHGTLITIQRTRLLEVTEVPSFLLFQVSSVFIFIHETVILNELYLRLSLTGWLRAVVVASSAHVQRTYPRQVY